MVDQLFLYLHLFYLQIVRNKWSGFDVCKMDYITRDSHNTVMSGNMEWRYYTNSVQQHYNIRFCCNFPI